MFDDSEDSGDELFFSDDIDEPKNMHDYCSDKISVENVKNIPKDIKSAAKQSFADYGLFKHHVISGDVSAVTNAIEQGIDIETKLDNDWTALLFASYHGSADVVQILLENGTNPNIQIDGFTPLHAVTSNLELETEYIEAIISALISHGANPNVSDRFKITPLMFASKAGRTGAVEKLIEAGAIVNALDFKNWTPLGWASYYGKGQTARSLLEHGADPLVVTIDGETAADLARLKGHEEIANVVESHHRQRKTTVNGRSSPHSENLTKLHTATKRHFFGELDIVLNALELTHLMPVFDDHSIDFTTFLKIDENDLDRLEILKVGERIKIIDAIKQIHTREWETSSLPALHLQKYITCPDAIAMIENIVKQTQYMEASVGYLRGKLRKNAQFLELGKEAGDIKCLKSGLKNAYKTVVNLEVQIESAVKDLDDLRDGIDGKFVDTITANDTVRIRKKHIRSCVLVGTILVFIYLWRNR